MTYAQAIRQALEDSMAADDSVVVLGQAVADVRPTYGTAEGLAEKFGADRCFNTPLSEEGMTGAAVGMALAGLRPVLVHIRADFMLLSFNQLVNMAAKVRWMYGGRVKCPLVVRAIIGKSWGNGPQHTQGVYPMLLNVPGLKVVAPAFPGAAYLALRAALREDDPVIFVEHRLCHALEGDVDTDEHPDTELSGQALTHEYAGRGAGDVTLVGVSWMGVECLRAMSLLAEKGIRADVVVPTVLAPLGMSLIEASVARTGRLVVVDCSWTFCGWGAEVVARLAEDGILPAGGKIRRMGFAPTACPTSPALEADFYPDAKKIARTAYALITGDEAWEPAAVPADSPFKGPF